MAPKAVKGKPKAKAHQDSGRLLKRKRGQEEISDLVKRVEDLDTKASLKNFSELPLSEPTASGLSASHYKTLTDIQARAISHALKGRDILGAAKTGSGKTLAFLVPVIENLYRKKWTELDGLGALILSPTRELAIQIFEQLRKIGRNHHFSAGLIIGGKSLREEQDRMGRMNILVCTPGRMLQHLDQTAMFETNNLQMLVLDEADRILDMGFQKTVDAIVDHLPKERQTMLFSATQTKKVGDLARLSLRDPEYVSVHEAADAATPTTLQQHYTVIPLPQKLDTLWSFIRANLKAKTIVFLSSGKQVRYCYEALRHLQPGISLMHLHGRQKQGGRLDVTTKFSQAQHAVLFATDVVARGLDFPAVDWVIQLDCPEDADTYIHRVGRTARYERVGRAVLFLDPSEEKGFLKQLEHKKVPVVRINIKANKQHSIKNQLQNMCFKDPELKYLGQKAFISYVKSIYVQKDKEVFKIKELPLEEFAQSLGLPGAPRIKFIKGDDAKERKNESWRMAHMSSDDESDAEKKVKKDEKEVRTRYDRMFERRNQGVLAEHYSKLINDDGTMISTGAKETGKDLDDEADEDADFLSVKRRFTAGDEELGQKVESSGSGSDSDSDSDADAKSTTDDTGVKKVYLDGQEPLIIDSKRREKLLKSKKKLLKFKGKGTKLIYDDEGNAHEVYEMEDEAAFKARGDANTQREKFLEGETERTRQADIEDKEIMREKRREKKEKRKARERAEIAAEAEEEGDFQGLSHLPHVPFEIPGSDSDSGEERKARPSKKQRVAFAESDEDKPSKGNTQPKSIETLGDLEALASGLLG
jgi:ATP-dependent RNA helicase DDX10/DBP4